MFDLLLSAGFFTGEGLQDFTAFAPFFERSILF
jgi:hypothetical protein